MKKIFLLLTVILIISITVTAQINRPNMKYGAVSAKDLSTKIYSIDSNAEAVVLYSKCDVKYEGNNSGWFNVVYKYQKKIHILNKNAFRLGTVEIPLRKYGNQEDKIEKLEAVTYNLENGDVKKTKIDKSSIFKDKVRKKITVMKFTFPELREGSIIEYAYTISTPVDEYLREWEFQGIDPVLWSEYNTEIPSIFNFQSLRQGYRKFTIDSIGISNDTYYILFPGDNASESSSVGSISLNTLKSKWALQDIQAMKLEKFTTTLDNHISKITFQLVSLRVPNRPEKKIAANWMQLAKDMVKAEYFGADLKNKNHWIEDDVRKAISGETNNNAKAKKIFEFVRDNYSCISYDAYALSEPLKKIYQAKKGSVADINLVLTTMYNNAGFVANPVILSTRDNGYTSDLFPLIDRYNYTICRLEVDNEVFLLDASHPRLGFGKLPNECYNGSARLIDEIPYIINLSADSIKETKFANVFISNNEKGGMSGAYSNTLGYFESYDLREKLISQKQDEFFADLKKAYAFEITMQEKNIEDLKEYEKPVKVKYEFDFKVEDDIIYFTPLLTEAYKNNPFKAEARNYPVEMPHAMQETFILNIETPKGYEIDELPKSSRVMLNETEGMFEYIIGKTNDGIQLRSVIKINKANFTNEDYQTLRDFFGYIVKKHAEQIVYKKKK